MEYDNEQITVKMIKELIDFKDRTVLEIGCGQGQVASLLVPGTRRYIGIDPDIQAIDQAIATHKDVEFKIGSGEALEFENSRFDIVLFTLSLHHQNSRDALNEAHRVLRDNGRLLILEPAIDGEFQQFFNLFNDETQVIQNALESILKSQFILEHQDTFQAKAWFSSLSDLCDYHFDRETVTASDAGRIIELLNRTQTVSGDQGPIFLNDKIDIYRLAK